MKSAEMGDGEKGGGEDGWQRVGWTTYRIARRDNTAGVGGASTAIAWVQ